MLLHGIRQLGNSRDELDSIAHTRSSRWSSAARAIAGRDAAMYPVEHDEAAARALPPVVGVPIDRVYGDRRQRWPIDHRDHGIARHDRIGVLDGHGDAH
ncbi:MAG: hypothetical protein U0168_29560 [Nannocystaceae bacterium]